MDKLRRKEIQKEESKYMESYLREVNTTNSVRLAIAFGLIFAMELFIAVGRVAETGVLVDSALTFFSMLKLLMSSSYLIYFFVCRRKMSVLPYYFRYIIFISLVVLGMVHLYLLYDELVTVHTVYNHLYYLIILAWAMIYPPRKIFPLFAVVTAASYIILFAFSNEASVGNNIFALTIFSITSPIASFVIFRNHFTGYINKEKLNQATMIDYLTKIYNRRGFFHKIELTQQTFSNDKRVAALMADVDSFKLYNDNYGHDAGDHCLRAIASTFPKVLYKKGQVYARFGGEEFAVAFFGYTDEEVLSMAEQIRKSVDELAIPHEYSRSGKTVSISIGVYGTQHASDASIEELLKEADSYLYKAKMKGGNNVVAYME